MHGARGLVLRAETRLGTLARFWEVLLLIAHQAVDFAPVIRTSEACRLFVVPILHPLALVALNL